MLTILCVLQNNHTKDAIHRAVAQRDVAQITANIQPGIIPFTVTITCVQSNVTRTKKIFFVPRFPCAGIEYQMPLT